MVTYRECIFQLFSQLVVILGLILQPLSEMNIYPIEIGRIRWHDFWHLMNAKSLRAQSNLNIAVIGTGVAGLTAAYLLGQKHLVTLYEKNDYLGGHTNTVTLTRGPDAGTPIDTGFIVYNDQNYPVFIRLLQELGIQGQPSDMSFSF